MFITLDQRFQIMKKYHLTSIEFDFIIGVWCFQGSTEEEDVQFNCVSQPEVYDYLYDWFEIHKDSSNAAAVLRSTIESLINKKIFLSTSKLPRIGEEFDPSNLVFNKIFIKGFIKHTGVMGQEFFRAYPSYKDINGTMMSLKNIAQRFESLEDFYFTYGKAINFNPENHARVMAILEKAKELGLVNEGILNFVISRHWETLEEEMHNSGVMNVITKSHTVNNG